MTKLLSHYATCHSLVEAVIILSERQPGRTSSLSCRPALEISMRIGTILRITLMKLEGDHCLCAAAWPACSAIRGEDLQRLASAQRSSMPTH